MLIDEIKKQVTQAMRDKDTQKRDLLKVVLGELQTAATRTGDNLDDEQAQKIIRKIVKSTQEMIELGKRPEAIEQAKAELVILESLLPKTLSVDEIIAALGPVADNIRAAGNDGQATGVAMKHLKSAGAVVEGKDVGVAVKQMRG
ncbi:MAG: GatB/YqeY domain-containing protein [Phycisphaerales bacterium]